MVRKKLPKQARNRLQIYLTNQEYDSFVNLQKIYDIKSISKMLRYMVRFVLDCHEKNEDFQNYIFQYVSKTEKVRENKQVDEKINNYPSVKNKIANAIEILENNEFIGDKKNTKVPLVFQAVDKVVEFFIKSTTSFYFLCKLINLYYFPYMSFFFVR